MLSFGLSLIFLKQVSNLKKLKSCDVIRHNFLVVLNTVFGFSNGQQSHEFCIPLTDIVHLEVYNLDTRSTVICWLPKSCGPFTALHSHSQVNSCCIDVTMLAKAFRINVGKGCSKGLYTFLYGLVFGRHQIQELYLGVCPKCSYTFCHLDGNHSECFKCQDCEAYFCSKSAFKEHQEVTKHYYY